MAWHSAQSHPAVLWVYREVTETQKPRQKRCPSQTQCLGLYLRSGFHFLYRKTESDLCWVISEFAEQELHLSDPISTEHSDQQAPTTIGESIQLEKKQKNMLLAWWGQSRRRKSKFLFTKSDSFRKRKSHVPLCSLPRGDVQSLHALRGD